MVYFDQHRQSGDSFTGGTCTSMVLLKCDYNCLLYCNILYPTQNNLNRVDPCSCFLKSGGCDPNWASEQVTAESSGLPFLPAKQPTALFFSLFGDNSQEFVLRGLSQFEAQRGLFSSSHISHIIVCQELVIHPTSQVPRPTCFPKASGSGNLSNTMTAQFYTTSTTRQTGSFQM